MTEEQKEPDKNSKRKYKVTGKKRLSRHNKKVRSYGKYRKERKNRCTRNEGKYR